jgi:hypothetical protein
MATEYKTETRVDSNGQNYDVRIPIDSNTISSATMAPVPPVPVANPVVDNTNHAAIIAGSAQDLQAKADAAQKTYDEQNAANLKASNEKASMESILGGQAAETKALYDTTGVTALAKQLSDLNAQAKNLNLEAQAIPIQTQENNRNTGATDAGVAPQTAGNLRLNALKALSLSQQANIATGNYEAAKANADAIISAKYSQIEADIKSKQTQLDALDKYSLTPAQEKQKTAQQALLTKQAQDIADKKAQETTNASNQVTWANNAYQSGDSGLASKISKLDPGSTTFKADLATLQAQVKLTPDQLYKMAQTNALTNTNSTGNGLGAGTGAINVASTAGITDLTIPLSQAITNVGINNIVNGIINNEGKSISGVQNNPGNIKYNGLTEQTDSGVVASDGGTYANYATLQEGKDAIGKLLQGSTYAGLSFQDAINKYTNTYGKAGAIGTTGSPNIDATKGGYATDIVPGTGGLTQAAIDQDALATALGQPLPVPLGLSSTGAGGQKRTAINNRMAEINSGGNVAANKQKLTADSKSLSTQTNYLDTVTRAFNTANDTLLALTDWMIKNGVNASQFPDINKFNNFLKGKGIDPGQAGGYNAQIATLRQEYSQVLAKGGVRSVETDNQAKSLIPDGLSPAQLQTVADRIKIDSENVINDAQKQVQTIQDRINGIVAGVPGITYPTNGNAFSVGGYNINLPQQ